MEVKIDPVSKEERIARQRTQRLQEQIEQMLMSLDVRFGFPLRPRWFLA